MPKMSRRTFLWVTGGTGISLAAASQRKLVNKLIPQVIPAENIQPGEWAILATTCRECPAGCGMHLWHRDGRVTKAEGNPDHPVNGGGLCPRGQAALQGLYDPDRLKEVTHRTARMPVVSTWNEALSAISAKIAAGGKVAILSSLQSGALAEVLQRFAAAFGTDRLLFYEPFSYEPLKNAHDELFGLPVIPAYHLEQSSFTISFAADFLETWISPVRYASDFGELRAWQRNGVMSRMIYVGPRLSMTAANADEFIQVPPGAERLVAESLLRILMARGWVKGDPEGLRAAAGPFPAAGAIKGVTEEKLVQLARSFSHSPGSLALAGPVGGVGSTATGTARAVALLNHAAGGTGRTVDFARTHALSKTGTEEEIDRFLASLRAEDILFVVDANPAYSRFDAASHLGRAGTVVYLGTMPDETAALAQWVLPVDSPLESWGDYEPETGLHSLLQPVLSRLYNTASAGDIFMQLARRAGKPLARSASSPPPPDFVAWLSLRWEELRRKNSPQTRWETFWSEALRRGGLWEKPKPVVRVSLKGRKGVPAAAPPARALQKGEMELWPWSSIMLYDGRFANRGWIQEAPDPVTFITWGNWIDIHPAKAALLNLKEGDLAELTTTSGTVKAPVRVTAEVSSHTAAIAFGQGHTALGRTAVGIGVNAFLLLARGEEGTTFARATLRKAGERRPHDPTWTAPSRQQFHRELLQWMPATELGRMKQGEGAELKMPLPEGYRNDRDLYPRREYLAHRWAMTVDLQRCIGCGACAVACYAENNIAVMGKKQVARQLEMAWLRVVPYRKEGTEMRYSWLPLLCQHCDAAPCEPVCPVFAAVHNEEGLNAQIYNRCIGTRYCANNCPYKVRRFNWLNVEWQQPLDLQLNPEVTVRCRGVMEKCTFCIQRIRQAEYRAARENRQVRDGEIQPACAQSCPTRAYTFGDLLDPAAKVTRLVRSDPRRYQLLEELNTKPAVIYLKRVENDVRQV